MRKSWIVSGKNKNNTLGRKPKFSVQGVNRCKRCGRAKGYMGFFGVCRICFRELADNGNLPGVKKTSW